MVRIIAGLGFVIVGILLIRPRIRSMKDYRDMGTMPVSLLMGFGSLVIGLFLLLGIDLNFMEEEKIQQKQKIMAEYTLSKDVPQLIHITKYKDNIRSEPWVGDNVIGNVRKGERYKIYEDKGNWLKIRLNEPYHSLSTEYNYGWTHNSNGIMTYKQGELAVSTSKPESPPRPKAPPKVQAGIAFQEPSGDNALDAEEIGKFLLTVKNTGQGKAYNVKSKISPRSLPHLNFNHDINVGDLASGQEKTLEIPITALFDIQTQKTSLTFSFSEANGFYPSPVKVTFSTRAFVPPVLTIAEGVDIEDANENRLIDPGEVVKINVRIQNMGRGSAKDVRAVVRSGDPSNVSFTGDSKTDFHIGTLEPGSYKDIFFKVYTNMDATELPIYMDLTESYGKFSTNGIKLPLEFKKHLPEIKEVVYKAREETERDVVRKEVVGIDVDRNIPTGRTRNTDAFAVIFGVQDYKKLPEASFARADANVFKRYVVNVLGVPDDKNHIVHKTDNEVSLSEFKRIFEGVLSRRVLTTSDVYVYFSGHGAPHVGSRHPYLMPYEGDADYPQLTGAYSGLNLPLIPVKPATCSG